MKQFLLIFFLSMLSLACVKDLDLDQTDVFISNPIPIKIALLNYQVDKQIDIQSDNYYDMDIYGIFEKNTNRNLTFTSYFTNTFDTKITCIIEFYKEDTHLLSTRSVDIPPHTPISAHFKQELIFENLEYDSFITANKANIKLVLDGLPNVSDSGIFEVQSVISADLIIEQKPNDQ